MAYIMKTIIRVLALVICLCLSCTSALAVLTSDVLQNNAVVEGSTKTYTLSQNETVESTISLSSNYTIILNGFNITAGMSDPMFYTCDGATLVLNGGTGAGVTISNTTGAIVEADENSEVQLVGNLTLTGNNTSITGVKVEGGASVVVGEGATIQNFSAQGIYVADGSVTIEGGTITGNGYYGIRGYGNDGTATITMTSGEISENGWYGILTSNEADIRIRGGKITGHTQTGLNVHSGEVQITGGEISDNELGVELGNDVTAKISGEALITENECFAYAGGVKNHGDLTISGGTISNNNACVYRQEGGYYEGTGGGVSNYGTLTMTGGEITGNTAYEYAGGLFNYGTATLSGGSISGNTFTDTDGFGTDVVTYGGSVTLNGTTVGEAVNYYYAYTHTSEEPYSVGGVYIIGENAVYPTSISVRNELVEYAGDDWDVVNRTIEPVGAGLFATGYTDSTDVAEVFVITSTYSNPNQYCVYLDGDKVMIGILGEQPKEKKKTVYYNEGDTLNIKNRGWIITELSFNEETGRYEWYLVNQQELTNEEMADPEGTLEKMLGDKKGDITAITADQKVLDRYFGGKHNHIMIYCTSEILH